MGDRGQFYMEDEKIYLYTHWGAYRMEKDLQAALDRGRGRWGDPEYFARILFCELVKDDIDGETGFGIGSEVHCDIRKLITVDCKNKLVSRDDMEWTFEEFIDQNFKEEE